MHLFEPVLFGDFACDCVLFFFFFYSPSDREFTTRAVPVQEAENLEPGKQCAAVPPLPGWRADKSLTDRAAGEPLGVPASGAGRVSSAET